VEIGGTRGFFRDWLFAASPQRRKLFLSDLGLHVTYSRYASLDALKEAAAAKKTDDIGFLLVRVEGIEAPTRIDVRASINRVIPLEKTDYSAKILRYLPDFAMTAGKPQTRSPDPNNPAVQIEIAGPEGVERRWAFSRMPDFERFHRRKYKQISVRYHFQAQGSFPRRSLNVLEGPNKALYLLTRPGRGEGRLVKAGLNEKYGLPGSEGYLRLLTLYEKAGVRYEASNSGGGHPRPALLIGLSAGAETFERWLVMQPEKNAWRGEFTGRLGPWNARITFGPLRVPLGFEIGLVDFKKLHYEGSKLPKSFESDIRLVDAKSGVTLAKTIRMNEPLQYRGYTFYQSSYDDRGRREASIFSVSRDPGYPVVFVGFVLLTVGVFVIFYLKAPLKRGAKTAGSKAAGKKFVGAEVSGAKATGAEAAGAKATGPEAAGKKPAGAGPAGSKGGKAARADGGGAGRGPIGRGAAGEVETKGTDEKGDRTS
jgi:hypothetical protein